MLFSTRGLPRSHISKCPFCGVGAEHNTDVVLDNCDFDRWVVDDESFWSIDSSAGITDTVLRSSVLI